MSNPENLDGVLSGKQQEDELAKLEEEKANSVMQAKNRYDALLENRREMESAFEERIKKLQDDYLVELDDKRNDYAQKMLDDSAKFQQLQSDKDDEARTHRDQLEAENSKHQRDLTLKKETFNAQMDA